MTPQVVEALRAWGRQEPVPAIGVDQHRLDRARELPWSVRNDVCDMHKTGGGIRTLERFPATDFSGRRLKPLGHTSAERMWCRGSCTTRRQSSHNILVLGDDVPVI